MQCVLQCVLQFAWQFAWQCVVVLNDQCVAVFCGVLQCVAVCVAS